MICSTGDVPTAFQVGSTTSSHRASAAAMVTMAASRRLSRRVGRSAGARGGDTQRSGRCRRGCRTRPRARRSDHRRPRRRRRRPSPTTAPRPRSGATARAVGGGPSRRRRSGRGAHDRGGVVGVEDGPPASARPGTVTNATTRAMGTAASTVLRAIGVIRSHFRPGEWGLLSTFPRGWRAMPGPDAQQLRSPLASRSHRQVFVRTETIGSVAGNGLRADHRGMRATLLAMTGARDPIPPTIEWRHGRVRLVDQRVLPHRLVFRRVRVGRRIGGCDPIARGAGRARTRRGGRVRRRAGGVDGPHRARGARRGCSPRAAPDQPR